MNIINEILEEDGFYHIYSRGINGCQIFDNEENYLFFLSKFLKYLLDYVDVYAYCLMPNHFHFLIKVKSSVINNRIDNPNLKGLHSSASIVSKQFEKFISSYTQSYNKLNNRHGALLESPFKRIQVKNEEYLKNLVLYIHLNPKDYKSYKFSSYLGMISVSKTNLKREEIIEIFEDVENFIYLHENPPKFDFKF